MAWTIEKQQERNEKLKDIGKRIEDLVNTYGRTKIVVTYEYMTEERVHDFSEWDVRRFFLHPSRECFFVWINEELIYVVHVDADSYLTAADELMRLVAVKC